MQKIKDMKLTYSYTAKANIETRKRFDESLLLCCNLYNVALEQRRVEYRGVMRRSVSCYDQQKQLTDLKKTDGEYTRVYSQTLQDVIERLDKSYKAMFGRCKRGEKPGFPRFRSSKRYTTLAYKEIGYKIYGNKVTFTKLGTFKMKLSRPIQGTIKYVTITKKRNNRFQIGFYCDNVPLKKLPKIGNKIGIDVGCACVVVDSNENQIRNPKFLQKKIFELKSLQQQYAKKKTNKTLKKLQKLHEKIANQRKDFLHKLTTDYIRNNDVICIEKISSKQISKKSYKSIRKSLIDASWGTLVQQLKYKAEYAGRKLKEVPAKNTSRKCSSCGNIKKDLKISDRTYQCAVCKHTESRDVNAAKNILALGLSASQ